MDNSVSQLAQFVDAHIVLIVAVTMAVLGFFVAYLIYSRPLQQAQRELEQLKYKLQTEEQVHEERLQMLDDAQDRLHTTFSSLSQRALRDNNQQFLQLAQENMKRFQATSASDLEQRQQAIHHLVEPIKQALQKTETQINTIEKERQSSFGALSEQMRSLSLDQSALRQETSKLSSALRTPGKRGQWGELSLKRIAELAGMVEHCDFVEQTQRSNDERTIRPDMIVRMPDARELIIDAKTPMDAYLDASDTEDEDQTKHHLQRYAKHVREHVRVLANKRYWEQFEGAPDFVVLFMPGEQFLGAALEQDKKLMQDAMESRVILATPATLMALLRSVAFGWQQSVLAENATKIRDVGDELHKRLAIFTGHIEKLGKQLEGSVDTYNKLLGSLERNVLPKARQMSELGISSGRELAEPPAIEKRPRTPVHPHKSNDSDS